MNIKFINIIILVIVIQLLNINKTQAQDARFSQFYMAQVHNNPGFVGIFPGQFRFMAHYRNQWSSIIGNSAYHTYAASFDLRFKTVRNDYFAFAVNLLRDDAGDSQFNQTKAHLSASFLKQLVGGKYRSDYHYITVGFQGGIGQHGINWSNLSFSNQFDNTNEIFDPNSPTGESFGESSLNYTDFNAGLAWFAVFDENKKSMYAGISLHHITQPNVAFLDGSYETLYSKILGQVGGEFDFNYNFSMLPALWVASQGPSFETLLGSNIRYSNNDKNELALRGGAWIRLTKTINSPIVPEALVVTSMLEIERILVGLSYDFSISSITAANNGRGAFELSFAYIHKEKSRIKVICPKF